MDLGEGVDPACSAGASWSTTAPPAGCVECRRARPAYCRHGVAQGVNAPGGFAEQVVTDGNRCLVVDVLDPEVAALTEPVACAVHGLDTLAPRADVLLFGARPTGLLLTSLLARSGAGRLVPSLQALTPVDPPVACSQQRESIICCS